VEDDVTPPTPTVQNAGLPSQSLDVKRIELLAERLMLKASGMPLFKGTVVK